MLSVRTVGCLLLVVLVAGWAWAQTATPEPQAQRPGRTGDAWACEIPVLQPAPHRLTDLCGNYTGRLRLVTKVACKTHGGTLRFRPELTGGDATSIVALPFTCTETWSEAVLNGQPRIASFSQTGMACPGICTIDFVIAEVQEARSATLVIAGQYE